MDAETSLDAWIAHNWRDTPRPPWPRETFKLFYQEQLDYQAKAQVKSAEAQEIASLRAEIVALRAETAALRGAQSAQAKRIKQLEELTAFEPGEQGRKGIIVEAVADAFGENAKVVNERLHKIHDRIEALEQRPTGLQWKGTWSPEIGYPGSAVVIKDGAAWVALEPTCPGEKPGAGGQWRLFVRSDETVLRKLLRDELQKPRAA